MLSHHSFGIFSSGSSPTREPPRRLVELLPNTTCITHQSPCGSQTHKCPYLEMKAVAEASSTSLRSPFPSLLLHDMLFPSMFLLLLALGASTLLWPFPTTAPAEFLVVFLPPLQLVNFPISGLCWFVILQGSSCNLDADFLIKSAHDVVELYLRFSTIILYISPHSRCRRSSNSGCELQQKPQSCLQGYCFVHW